MMDQNESFMSFWTSLRGGVGPHQFHQILDGLSDALRRLLYVPDITEWYSTHPVVALPFVANLFALDKSQQKAVIANI